MATISKDEYQRVQNAVNNAYTADSIKNYTNAYNQYMAQGMSSNDAYSKASSLLVKNGATTNAGTTPTKTTTTPTYTTTPTQNTTPTRTATSTPTNTQTTQSQSTTSTSSPISDNGATRQYWDNLSYEQQQEKLKQISGLKDALNKRGWAIKTPDGQTTQQTTQTSNVSNDGWDYQDNSPERMGQMVDNLEKMYVTDPGLFANEQTFKNFFINGKGRSPEQEQFLLDYYKNRNAYNQYDLLQPDKVGVMVANGQGGDTLNSYLNYLKNSNPQRYQEVMAAEQQEEDRIGNNSSYSDLLNQAGFEDTANTAWQKKEGLLVDENSDLIDDRLYHEPTAEEREKVDRINEIDSEVLDIENTYKHTYDDLVEKYPGATKATLMAMAQDRCSDLLRRKEDLMVERTKLAGTVNYLQSERQAQDDAGKQTIANLQKNLGMYYEYSPEGMADRVQAQYAATNVTLEQAENGTDTQKQMALENVLDGYYDKYGAIIQRSEQQVIGDIMKYAKDNGVSLSQALEENFLKPLRSKPEFATLSSGGDLSTTPYNPKVYKVGDTGYYFDENGNLIEINPSSSDGSDLGTGGLFSFTNYTPMSEGQKQSVFKSFMGSHPEGSTGGECGSFVNDYLQALGYNRWIGNSLSTKTGITNSDIATVGSVAVMNSSKHPANGHTAIVTDIKGDKVKLLESNRNDDHKVHTTRWVNKSDIIGYFDPSKSNTNVGAGEQGWNQNLDDIFMKWSDAAGDRLKEKDFWGSWKDTINKSGVSEKEFLRQYQEWYSYKSQTAYEKLLSDIDHLIELTGEDFSKSERAGVWSGIGTTAKVYNYIRNNQTLQAIIDAKNSGAKLGVLSDSDVKMLKEAASILDYDVDQATWTKELYDYRNTILNNNKYLKDKYKTQSAYSTDKWFYYNNDKKEYKVGNKNVKTKGNSGGGSSGGGTANGGQGKNINDVLNS